MAAPDLEQPFFLVQIEIGCKYSSLNEESDLLGQPQDLPFTHVEDYHYECKQLA